MRNPPLHAARNGQILVLRQQDRYLVYRYSHILAPIWHDPLRDQASQRSLENSQ